mmetsp:Transcript_6628/g.11691  ORF Transcript_6628/g.11691 Transcript_6628/m.11691 type:complete len:319 (+) Transcript_6628:2717-3673(+)
MELVATLSGHTDRVWQAEWDPNGQILATASGDKTAKIWTSDASLQSSSWTCKETLEGEHSKSVRSVAWSRSGEHLATASFDGTSIIWRKLPTGFDNKLCIEGHDSEVKSVSWSVDDQYLATCGRDKTVWVWETDIDYEYETAGVLSKHTQDVKMVKWHDSLLMFASASYDDTVIVWMSDGADDWIALDVLSGHESTVWAVDWFENNLASCSDDCTVKLWRKQDTRFLPMGTLSGHQSRTIYSVNWSPDGQLLASVRFTQASADNSICIYKARESGYELVWKQEEAHAQDVNSVSFHPTEPLIASSSDDLTTKLWRYSV